MTDAMTCLQNGQGAADHNGGILFRRHENMGAHGGGSCLAVGTGNAQCILVVCHNCAPSFRTFEYGNAHFVCADDFRVVIVNRSGADDELCIGLDVFCVVTVVHLHTQLFQMSGLIAVCHVGAGNGHTRTCQHFCQRAHAHAAYTDQVTLAACSQILIKSCHWQPPNCYFHSFVL